MNKEMNIDERLAVLASDVKKLITHFKLDRRKQGEEENPANAEDAASEDQMLRQIAATVKQLSERGMLSDEQLNRIINGAGEYLHQKQGDHLSDLKPVFDAIEGKLDRLPAGPQQSTVRHDHTYTVDFKSSKATITIISLAVGLLFSAGINIHQANRNSDLRDSDVKYRYVKMNGEASAEDVYRLESIFGFDRNNDSVKIIRRQVENYERLLKEYNEKQLQIRLNDERARQIEQEAATVKGNK
ncbi:MAG: hypothetical protein LUE26_11200 [Alistipes sp.]|nr:hypothetical protein [Alistipes sp.]